jgi:hypothetical protein
MQSLPLFEENLLDCEDCHHSNMLSSKATLSKVDQNSHLG